MSAVPIEERPRLIADRLSIGVAGRLLVSELSFQVPGGTVTAVLGRNGAGKTLTLHTLAGIRAPLSGAVLLDDERLSEWARRPLARVIGLLAQTSEDAFPSTVLDAALVGRHPYIGFWEWESDKDRQAARAALAAVGMDTFEAREIATLSGGERRRVALAAILTQDPDLYLLDEPINHLDPHHQIDVLRLMRKKASEGRSIVMSLHDAGLAARFSDQVLLLFGNGEWLCGPTPQVLTETTMSQLYGLSVREVDWPGGRTFVMG